MIRRPPRSTPLYSSAASDVYKRQVVFADDDILRDVHETTREVTRVRGTQSRVGQTLTSTVSSNEVLGDGQTFAVARDDRARDDLALRVVHQASHAGDVANLQPVTTSTGRDHAVDGVVLGEVLLHGLGNVFRCLRPDLDELLATLEVGGQTLLELRLNLGGLLLIAGNDLRLVRRGQDVAERDGHTGAGSPVETGVLDAVKRRGNFHLRVPLGEVVDDRREGSLVGYLLEVRVVNRHGLVEDGASERRGHQHGTDSLAAHELDAFGLRALGEVLVLSLIHIS